MTFLGLRPSSAPALVEGRTGQVVSYRRLLESAAEAVGHMERAKQLLFLLCRNDVSTATTYLGAVLAGHAVAMLDARSPAEATAALSGTYRPGWVAGPPGSGQRLGDAGMPVEKVISLGGSEMVRTGHGDAPKVHPDLTLMLTTSGTTGSSKFVRLAQRNIHANATSIAGYLGLGPSERPITSLPLHYSFGLSVLNSHWLAGGTVVLSDDSVVQGSFWEQFRTERCTSLAGVPYTYQMLERVGFRDMELPSLQTMQQAGGALDRRLTQLYAEFMARREGRLFVMYGQTEATARIAYVPPDRLTEKLGSAGIAVPGGRLLIDGESSEPSDGAQLGEVIYEGPNVMMGYATDSADLVLGDTLGGQLRTGDIGYLDDEGFLYLVGRSKRITKVFGLRVNLDEVESIVREYGPVAVVGREDAVWAFCAFGSDEEVAQIADTLARRFRLHHSALHLRRVDAIPTTVSGKIDYQQVRAWMSS
jgi:long-chain acyl-CoA synthetase